MTSATRRAEGVAKAERVRGLLDAQGLDAVVLRSPANAAWWSGGGRTHVELTSEVGVADLVLTRDDAGTGIATTVVTWVNEATRLQAEELAGLEAAGPVHWQVLPWTQRREGVLPTGPRVGSDLALPGCVDVSSRLVRLRAPLVPAEVERLRALGRDAAQALTAVCARLSPAATEQQTAGRTAAALLDRGVEPVVLLVAGQARAVVHRHPLPTPARLGAYAMVVVCARRAGLVVSLTRLVGALPTDRQDAFDRLLHVDARANLATRPGRRIGQVVEDLRAAYVAHGFAEDEWTRHHQGGPAGYQPRDVVARPDTEELVADRQCFAWNPTGAGVKSEDTILATPDGPEVVTIDAAWPTRVVSGVRRPLVLPWG